MGLLDEAIREHLELKRRSGADASDVAREEHEALARTFPDEGATSDAEPHGLAREAVVEQEHITEAHAVRLAGDPQLDPVGAGLSTVGEETAELDMQLLLEDSPSSDDAGSPLHPPAVGPAQAPGAEAQPGQNRPEWGFSGKPGDGSQGDMPGRGSETFE